MATTANTATAADQAKAATDQAKATADRANQTATKMAEEATRRMEENAERMKEFSSSMVESTKAGSRVAVDNYETAAKSVFEMQRQMAGTSRVEWMKDAAHTQIQFAEDVTNAWVKAARELLK
ncbi:hypothetical protein E7744_12510 [Citricoccus sp. SGAir0253]|uniref:hypothetical protein n=1 Tax=Citricoccus sp. SGAir0253 TaxID=2567881 RepID=UPI0010CCB5AB|nr:hypothetical protein [Citricoccus sp. SGAir0253]QCU78858.1 hypothetical protein E7744_12510 [Citricoccus sp. SGAir0253]